MDEPTEMRSPGLAETLAVLREAGVVQCELYESGALKSAILGPLDAGSMDNEERPRVSDDGVKDSLTTLASRRVRRASGGTTE